MYGFAQKLLVSASSSDEWIIMYQWSGIKTFAMKDFFHCEFNWQSNVQYIEEDYRITVDI